MTGKRHFSEKLGLSLVALLPVIMSPPCTAQTASVRAPEDRPLVALTLPLVFAGAASGEIVARVGAGDDIAIESHSLREQLVRLLNESGRQRLDEVLAGKPFVHPADLERAGIAMRYDPARLELLVDGIDNSMRAVETIGGGVVSGNDQTLTISPAKFSAYLNLTANMEYRDGGGGVNPPDLYMFGAARVRDFVVEIDGGFTNSFSFSDDDYRLYRRAARLVYDDAKNFRRFSAGDLRLTGLQLLQTQFIGGIGVEKSRRIFDPFSPTSSAGGRRIFLDSASTVNVLVNGSPYQTLDLQPGVYDLSQLPLQYGSNDVRLVIRDAAGREQVTSFSQFLDIAIDLAPGEDEYSLGVGVTARELAFSPTYSKNPILVGHYRKALDNQLILGGGIQIGEQRQVVAAETRFVPGSIPGAFELQSAASFGDGTGFAARGTWRWLSADIARGKSMSISLDYRSSNFRLVADPLLTGSRQFSATASYSQNLGPQTGFTLGVNYLDSEFVGKRKGIFADVNHSFNPRVRGSIGAQYEDGNRFAKSFGVRARISVAFGARSRAEASYESRNDNARISLTRDTQDHVGSIGYGVIAQSIGDQKSIDISSSYVGNRFDARLSVVGRGSDFGSFARDRTARLQIGTSLAFADGMFGIGRPISDSFVLAKPHESLKDTQVIVGRELAKGRYEGRSGPLGAAVTRNLTSYNAQNVLYDVDNVDAGYDIGSGVVRVNPPFRSGNTVIVGTDRFVSAVGILLTGDDPASLLSGTLSAIDDEGFTPKPFFTNSAGRFSLLGLAPGGSYRIDLQDGRSFTIKVPSDNKGLYRMEPARLVEKE